MSNPKPFLEPDDLYARVKELERIVKALHVSPQTQVSGTVAASVAALEGLLSAGGWVDLATPGPSVTATIGPSGSCVLMAFALNANDLTFPSPMTGQSNMGVTIDSAGGNPSAARQMNAGVNGGLTGSLSTEMTGSVGIVRVETGLTPGSHTFKMRYQMLSGVEAWWGTRTIIVIPL